MKKEIVTHNGREYEIRGGKFGESYQAAVFHNGKKLCENLVLVLSIDTEHDIRFFQNRDENPLDFLFRGLKTEILAGKFESAAN
jgi:hypothetical protein